MKKNLLIIFLLFAYVLAFSQSEETFKTQLSGAEYHYMNEEYDAALSIYTKLLKQNTDHANLNYRVGLCLLNLPFEYIKSIEYFKKAIKNLTIDYNEGSYKEVKAPISALFYLGYAYHLSNLTDEALVYYNRYRDTLPVDDVYNMTMVERQIISAQTAKEIKNNPVEVEISNIGNVINSSDADYNPAVTADGKMLIYTHDKPLEKRDTASFYLKNLYREILVSSRIDDEKWSKPVDISKELNTKGECQTLSLSADGKTLLLYKDDWNDGGIVDFKAGTIYISYYDDEEKLWTPIEKVSSEINSMNWETHACISPDGNSIYFTSDRKGGFGGQDVYVISQDKNGNWGKAKNLGATINTKYDENTPYILSDSVTLYFSSEGHTNMGGYDVFTSKRQKDGSWSEPQNIGYPLNSTGDNLFYVPIKGGSTAFYAVERHEGYFTFGSKDIYQIDIVTNEIAELPTDMAVDTIAVADTIIKDSLVITQSDLDFAPMVLPKVTEKNIYTIRNIFFDFDKAELDREAKIEAEKLAALMNENPSLYIEIIGHTDSKGDADYNKKLSVKRSRAVAQYLIERGIEKTRFVTSGMGATKLLAKETESGQKYNRRVEVKIIKSDENTVISIEEMVPEELRLKEYNRFSIVLTESEAKIVKNKFKGLKDVVLTMQTDKGFLYYCGNYSTKADAVGELNKIISNGFPQAYIIDYFELNKKNKFVTIVRNEGLIKYTIQLKAIDKKILLDAKLKGVQEQRTKDGYFRYTYKEFTDLKDAEKVLDEVIELGFDSAFIIESYKLRQ